MLREVFEKNVQVKYGTFFFGPEMVLFVPPQGGGSPGPSYGHEPNEESIPKFHLRAQIHDTIYLNFFILSDIRNYCIQEV